MRPRARARTTQTHRALTTPTPTPTPTPKTPLRPPSVPMTSSVPRHRRSRGAPRPTCARQPAPTPPLTTTTTRTRARTTPTLACAIARERASTNACARGDGRRRARGVDHRVDVFGHSAPGTAECPNAIPRPRLDATPRTPPNTYCTRISRRVRCVVNRPETTKVDDAVVVARAIPLSPTRALDRQRTFIMVRNA